MPTVARKKSWAFAAHGPMLRRLLTTTASGAMAFGLGRLTHLLFDPEELLITFVTRRTGRRKTAGPSQWLRKQTTSNIL